MERSLVLDLTLKGQQQVSRGLRQAADDTRELGFASRIRLGSRGASWLRNSRMRVKTAG